MFSKADKVFQTNSIKHETKSGNKHCEKSHFTDLTFRMLCNIHFQKYDRYKILTTIIYCYEKGLEPRLRQLIYSSNLILTLRLKEQQPLTANVGI